MLLYLYVCLVWRQECYCRCTCTCEAAVVSLLPFWHPRASFTLITLAVCAQ